MTTTRQELPATQPAPADYPNKPWSLPPCANPSPMGEPCTLIAHSGTIIDGEHVLTHSAQVKVSRLYLPLGAKRRKRATFSAWTSWQTSDGPA